MVPAYIDGLRRKPVYAANQLCATVHRCPQCRDSSYLLIEYIQYVPNGNGQPTKKSTTVVENLRIPEETAERLQLPVALLDLPEEPAESEGEMELAEASV